MNVKKIISFAICTLAVFIGFSLTNGIPEAFALDCMCPVPCPGQYNSCTTTGTKCEPDWIASEIGIGGGGWYIDEYPDKCGTEYENDCADEVGDCGNSYARYTPTGCP